MFGGLSAFLHLHSDHHMSLGMQDVQLSLAIASAAIIVVSLIGMLATAEDSKCLAKFVPSLILNIYDLIIVLFSTYNGFGIAKCDGSLLDDVADTGKFTKENAVLESY